jgi:hypothetical protein
VQVHRRAVADRQPQGRALALARANGAEDIGGGVALILRRGGSAAAARPSAGDRVLLAYPGLVGEPELQRLEAEALIRGDACQRGGEFFLNASIAPGPWAWCFGRAESLR